MSGSALGQDGPLPVVGPQQEAASRPGTAVGRIEVWVDLAPPAVAMLPPAASTSRSARTQAVKVSQDVLASNLNAIGAIERGRVRLVRNALVVDVDASMLDHIRRMPGVLAVTPVSHRDHTGAGPTPK
jgi:hypothetical protein